ncbi:MAG: exodeoxyribonuclease VII small subunit [Minwuiales bacterium]|nr:exodeoxyribonuclease VII small subunit [Minwuiales bacterium]
MSEKPKIPDDIAAMTFEESLAALEQIVGRLESGDVSLEESIDIYTRGTQLKAHCESKLRAAQEKIEKIVVGPGGEPAGVEPAGIE